MARVKDRGRKRPRRRLVIEELYCEECGRPLEGTSFRGDYPLCEECATFLREERRRRRRSWSDE